MQILVPEINNNSIKVLAWMAFLIPAAINITLILFYLLGIHHLTEIKQKKGWRVLGKSITSRAFMITIITIALSTVYISSIDMPSYNEVHTKNHVVSVLIDPCVYHSSDVSQLKDELDRELIQKRQRLHKNISHTIDTELNQTFSRVELGVDDFLDWYYTVTGEYERLSSVVTENIAMTIQGKLKFYLFRQTEFNEQLNTINHALNNQNKNALLLIGKQTSDNAANYLFNNTCTFPQVTLSEIQSFNGDSQRVSAAMMTGAIAGTSIAKGAGKIASTEMISKIAGKKMFKGSVSLIIKAIAKKGGSSLLGIMGAGAVAGSFCGPVCSAVGGVLGGVVTWLAVDKTMITIDEHLNRIEFKKEILSTLAEHKKILSEQMKKDHYTRVDTAINAMNTALNNDFIPYKDSF